MINMRGAICFISILLVYTPVYGGSCGPSSTRSFLPKKYSVVVTGANGFIGSALVRHFANKDHPVTAVVRQGASLGGLGDLSEHSKVTIRQVDYGHMPSRGVLIGVFSRHDVVINTIGYVWDVGTPEQYKEANITLTEAIAHLSAIAGVKRFIHFSTADVLGIRPHQKLDDQSPVVETGYSYPDSKIQGEDEVWRIFDLSNLPTTILRPTWVYGPGDRKFFPELRSALAKKELVYFGRPSYVLNMNFIENLVAMVEFLLGVPESVGRAFVTSETTLSWRELVQRIAHRYHLAEPTHTLPRGLAKYAIALSMEWMWRWRGRQGRPTLSRFVVDIMGSNMTIQASGLTSLGFQPPVNVDEAFTKTFEWLDQHSEP